MAQIICSLFTFVNRKEVFDWFYLTIEEDAAAQFALVNGIATGTLAEEIVIAQVGVADEQGNGQGSMMGDVINLGARML